MKNFLFLFLLSLCLVACGESEDPGSGGGGETLPVVSLDGIDVLEGNVNKSIFVSVRLSKSSTQSVTIFVETSDGTAEAGSDYVAVSQAVEFAAGSVQENIKLDILGDEDSETDETFNLSIVNVSGATIGTGTIEITIENDDAGDGTVVIPPTGYTTPESYEGMTMIWSDEFGGDALNEAFWCYEIGNGEWGWGNNELQYYRRQNTSMVDGHLVIEAREEFINGFNYTSSRLITRDKFEFTFGRVDIRAVLPEGQGLWPALWMLGENITSVGWPRCGEIDIMEIIGSEPGKVHGTVHYADPNGNRIMNGSARTLTPGQKFSDEFHVFSLIWEEDSIKFLLDDVQYHSVTRNSLGATNPYPFNDPFFYIFNVAVGGQWPGSPDATTVFPQHMIVDYIRVFQPE